MTRYRSRSLLLPTAESPMMIILTSGSSVVVLLFCSIEEEEWVSFSSGWKSSLLSCDCPALYAWFITVCSKKQLNLSWRKWCCQEKMASIDSVLRFLWRSLPCVSTLILVSVSSVERRFFHRGVGGKFWPIHIQNTLQASFPKHHLQIPTYKISRPLKTLVNGFQILKTSPKIRKAPPRSPPFCLFIASAVIEAIPSSNRTNITAIAAPSLNHYHLSVFFIINSPHSNGSRQQQTPKNDNPTIPHLLLGIHRGGRSLHLQSICLH